MGFCATLSHMEKVPKDQGVWNAVASIGFLVVFVFAFISLTDTLGMSWLYTLGTFDVAIISLATFRLIRLVTFDKIFAFVRNWFMDETASGWVKPAKGVRRLIAELIECIWCTGLWAALLATVLYLSSPMGYFFVLILAVAALGSFFQNVSKTVAAISERH